MNVRERIEYWLPLLESRDLGIAEFHAMQLKIAADIRELLQEHAELTAEVKP